MIQYGTKHRRFSWGSVAAAILMMSLSATTDAGESCQPQWMQTFGHLPGTSGGAVRATIYYDDGLGGGPTLYIGGSFLDFGGVFAARIARLDSVTGAWSAVGDGMNGDVFSLAVFDDGLGAGPALYAAGGFSFGGIAGANNIAKWDGTAWSKLGTGTNDTIYALAVFDDGSGPALYAGGRFTLSGGNMAPRIAKWNGKSWTAVGAGINNNQVNALTVFDDGNGPALYAGGTFTIAGNVAGVNRIAKWDGVFWEAVGFEASNGLGNFGVNALAAFDDGVEGPALYVGGSFTQAGGMSAINRIARWDGKNWTGLGTGIDTPGGEVKSLRAIDVGDGPVLYVGGQFESAGEVSNYNVAAWDGSTWSALDAGVNFGVNALNSYDNKLLVGGDFTFASGLAARGIAKWDGTSWSSFGEGLNNSVFALRVFDDGAGGDPALYAAGLFTAAGGESTSRIGRWNGTSWSTLGAGFGDNPPLDMIVFDDGTGSALYAGGTFAVADGLPAGAIAKWDGTSWSEVGGGVDAPVRALEVFDDGLGGGPSLYAAGDFFNAGGGIARRIARWNGANWSALTSGTINDRINDLVVFDAGSGPALYAAGKFTSVSGVTAHRVARWSGTTWSALASLNDEVWAMAVFDDGSGAGPALYAGGNFTNFGGGIAKWNHATGNWSGLGGIPKGSVRSLAVYDDGAGGGSALFAAGNFTTAGGTVVARIARWDATLGIWSPLGTGFANEVRALAVFDDGSAAGPALYAGGTFITSEAGDSYLARWQGCALPSGCPADLADDDGHVNVFDLFVLLSNWNGAGPGASLADPPQTVDVFDLFVLLSAWGECN